MDKAKEEYYTEIGIKGLGNYDIAWEKVSFVCEETNVFLRIDTTKGLKYAMKIFQEESSTIEDNQAEAFFLDTVSKHSSLSVPSMVKDKHGEWIVTVKDQEDVSKRLALYEWIDGVEIDEKETLDMFESIGKLCAQLHRATEGVSYPKGINPKRWDQVFYYRGEEAVYHQDKYSPYINAEGVALLDALIPWLNRQLKNLYVGKKSQLIHGDLNPYNIMIVDDKLAVIDFEEAFDALAIHDVAIHLFYYEYDKRFDIDQVYNQFMKGYNSIIDVDGFDRRNIEMLMTARRVNFINYALTIMDEPKEYIERQMPRVVTFMKKYGILEE